MARMAMGRGKTNHHKPGGYFRPGYAYLTCEVEPAAFENECFVRVKRLDGTYAAAIIDRMDLKAPTEPLTGRTQGEITVGAVEKIDGGFLVELPEGAINESRVRVPLESVRFP